MKEKSVGKITELGEELLVRIGNELKDNNNSLSFGFVTDIATESDIHYYMKNNTMSCYIKTKYGHNVEGHAKILDIDFHDEDKGKIGAFNRARDRLWDTLGAIAVLFIEQNKV